MPPPPPDERPLWPYRTAGALLLLALLVVPQIGAYEGGDVVLVLGLPAVIFGALLGGLVGAAVHRLTREPEDGTSAQDAPGGEAGR